jgi:hypothetical protein
VTERDHDVLVDVDRRSHHTYMLTHTIPRWSLGVRPDEDLWSQSFSAPLEEWRYWLCSTSITQRSPWSSLQVK